MMQLNYNLGQGLQVSIEEFKNMLPSLKSIKESSDFSYGCCGKPIDRPGNAIESVEKCPHCLDYYELENNSKECFRPLTTGGYINDKPILNADGEQLFVDKTISPEGVTKKQLEEKYGVLVHVGKRKRTSFTGQQEFDIVYNITEFVTDSLQNMGIYTNGNYDQFRGQTMFGADELEYISRKGLNSQFAHIMTVKQIVINKFLMDCVRTMMEKMGRAGMELM